MDDLYSNAWSDPPESVISEQLKPSTNSGDSWVSPKLAVSDEEADLATPSWSTGAGVQWNEPSVERSGFSWTQTEPDLAWGSSTYESIQINKSAAEQDEPSSSTPEEEEETAVTSVPVPQSALELEDDSFAPASPTHTQLPLSPVQLPDLEASSPSADLDVFGTFESAIVPDEGAALALEEKDLNADAWGAAWANGPEASAETAQEPVDEWEAARQRKAQLDRRVPPEMLAAMLSECEPFAREAWPEPTEETQTGDDKRSDDWRSGMEGVEGLESFIEAFLPPLTLQPPVQFGKTTIAKKTASSVRLTKNLAMTKNSPMSHYLAARGSTAWEAAVKQRKEVVEDDVPLGWRILEKEPTNDAAVDANKTKKTSGRLFSFWSRRESSTGHSRSPSSKDTGDQVGAESTKIATSRDAVSHSRQGSQDSVKSSTRSSVDKEIFPVQVASSSTSSLPNPTPAAANTAAPSVSPSPVLPTPTSSYADAPEPQIDSSEAAPPPAPSAVSRFLNRFSRRRSTMGVGNARSSLALSSDDLEFLSDIVPSAHDDAEDDIEASMKALSTVLKPEPLPPILPPPPPAPPRSVSSAGGPSSAASSAESPMNSFDSFFNSLDTGASGSASNASPSLSGTEPLQPTLAAPILKPPRPSTPSVPILPVLSRRDTRPSSPSPLSVGLAKQPSAPFYLPSPPSSRSQTPVSAFSNPSSQLPVPESKLMDTARHSRAPPPLFPPPRPSSSMTGSSGLSEAENQPDTPTSSLPLGELYPNAMRPNGTPEASAVPKPLPSFPPPPPSSRTHSATVLPPPLAPPPSSSAQLKRPASLPLAAFGDDDDEFTDFLSSSTVPVQSKPVLAKRPSMSRTHTPTKVPLASTRPSPAASVASSHPTMSLPSTSQPPATSTTKSSVPQLDLLNDDDFSDFHSSSTMSTQPPSGISFDSPSFSDFQSSTSSTFLQSQTSPSFESPAPDDSFSSEKSFLTPAKALGFDMSGLSPILRTPSPPRPISKTPPRFAPPPSIALKVPRPHQPNSGPSSRLNKAASHLHTLDLVERAAARPGRWPAPPSPLPQPIPPVPGSSSAAKASADLLGDDGPFGQQPQGKPMSVSLSSPALMSPARSSRPNGLGIGNIPTLPPPMSQSQSLQGSFKLFDSEPRIESPFSGSTLAPRPATATPSAQPSSKTGGLSAQDLSFFEGL